VRRFRVHYVLRGGLSELARIERVAAETCRVTLILMNSIKIDVNIVALMLAV